MATYLEIRNLYNNDDLRNRVEIATVVAAHGLLGGSVTLFYSDQMDLVRS